MEQENQSRYGFIFFLLLLLIGFVCIFPQYAFPFLSLSLENLSYSIWNAIVIFCGMSGLYYFLVLPMVRFIFPDRSKLGQKIEFYDRTLVHLTPDTKALSSHRLEIIFVISFCIYHLDIFLDHGQVLGFLPLVAYSSLSAKALSFMDFPMSDLVTSFLQYLAVLYVLQYLENKSRCIERLLRYIDSIRLENYWKRPLPLSKWKENSKEFSLSIFTKFVDKDGNDSIRPTKFEEEYTLDEKSLKANVGIICPTDGGKTQTHILPTLKQAIFWNRNDPENKAAISAYDPKGDLTEKIISLATEAGRKDDLVVLSSVSEWKTNIIKVKNIWDDVTSYKVTGWIIEAWQNFQGKSSPEPYWESQSYFLIRNILVILYATLSEKTTLSDIARLFFELDKGTMSVFFNRKTKSQEENVTNLGRRLLAIAVSTMDDETEIKRELDNYKYFSNENEEFSREVLDSVNSYIDEERAEYLKVNDIQSVDAISHKIELKRSLLGTLKDAATISSLRIEIDQLEGELKLVRTQEERFRQEWEDRRTSLCIQMKIRNEASRIGLNYVKKIIRECDYDRSLYLVKIKNVKKIVRDSANNLFRWGSKRDDNKSSVLSNMRPFLQQFLSPSVESCLCSNEENLIFSDVIDKGRIFVPDFPSIKLGNELSNALITLVKSRWQYAVLEEGTQDQVSSMQRLKFQLMDEAQRVINIGREKFSGDLEFMEVSRSFRSITVLSSQSVASLKAKAAKDVNWDKIHGVCRSWVVFSTNDPNTLREMKEIGGKIVARRVSKTIQEGTNSPKLDVMEEKFRGPSTMSVSYTTNESLEDRVKVSDINGLPRFTSLGFIYSKGMNNLIVMGNKPFYWKHKRDKWELMNKCSFDESNRSKVLWGKVLGGVIDYTKNYNSFKRGQIKKVG